jgi:methionine salvage enolase-phosphatase E1
LILLLGERREKILKWLSETPHQKHYNHAKERLLENIGEWLLDNQKFWEWKSSGTSGIFWLHGIREPIPDRQ